jgi:DNA-directed RNA polymerase specialized sigma24 family protein
VLQISELGDEQQDDNENAFTQFVVDNEPKLRRALVALYGTERGRDATCEALAYAWEHWSELAEVTNLPGYLFRVAQSRSRQRRTPIVFTSPDVNDGLFEPKLRGALEAMPDRQRLCVVLVHGYGWRVTEVAELIACKPTTVRKHIDRGMRRLRHRLGTDVDVN